MPRSGWSNEYSSLTGETGDLFGGGMPHRFFSTCVTSPDWSGEADDVVEFRQLRSSGAKPYNSRRLSGLLSSLGHCPLDFEKL